MFVIRERIYAHPVYFPLLVKVSINNTSIDVQLHITARDNHFDATMTLNVSALNLQRFRKVCNDVSTITFVLLQASQ
jgi:hypothetical protein